MDDRQEFNATYEGGVFKPDHPVDLPERKRVRLRMDEPRGSDDSKQSLLRLIDEIRRKGTFTMGDKPFDRNDLYERD